ncbi:acetyltransferase component of pyruvate dehydrogenase complex [Salinibacterium xinjiangense]|uniref:Dihydrolipoamide acetyltransferase component of pyruvate dehydrogenase complex n=1 Tax=Salinibacterium xinjiangense TaxID=386302 RepID=A0A2C8YG46_9MICO|nr:dihydrolipoamide acetyltransferase family protein [Salinibacterium xinjiangense]GGK96966.1 acetyltransferase component of pyruvate dehydrogenase complex [Salinibacterium xinjiangense]SOE49379.1 pyruvate dehydrogenase E2 component (dihydrolipoamide acetyltransferase) [Salinibacterium xinjiangense]
MATIIRMPEVLANSGEAAIQTWLVTLGQSVEVGVPLAEVETEKAIVEYASETSGTVLKLLVEEGVQVKVGDPIAVLGAEGENIDNLESPAPEVATAPTVSAPEPETAPERAPSPVAGVPVEVPAADPVQHAATGAAGDRRFVSPLVRRLARERGVDLASLTGTGPGGRVVRADLDRVPEPAAPVVTAAPAVASGTEEAFVDVPHTGMRRAIARRLTESKSTVPHFYLVADCHVDQLIALRKAVNESASVKVSLNDFVLKAAAFALMDVPEANVTWGETATRQYSTVDMSVAVSIDGGLVTPVLRSVEKQSLTEIARNVADLAERARAGRLKQHELEGGSFAVSNLGMFGVTEFSAIINPPQSAILAIGLARQQAIVVDGELAIGSIMTVTLSADHRALDGALAARWLAAFVKRIESPLGMLV